ncbi:MAG: hypothetical protein ACRERU_08385 [Methylococcales bacterium]
MRTFIQFIDKDLELSLQALLSQGPQDPILASLIRRPTADFRVRYARYHAYLSRLPRRTRRALQRQWRRSLSALALLLALGQAPALAETISIARGTAPDIHPDGRCALIEALENANWDARLHADCPAGSGADTIVLPKGSRQILTAIHDTTFGPSTGLPVITSNITIEGRNSTIARDSSAPSFENLAVFEPGSLTLNEITLTGADRCGVHNLSGDLRLTNSTVSGNRGGVCNVTARYSTYSATYASLSHCIV